MAVVNFHLVRPLDKATREINVAMLNKLLPDVRLCCIFTHLHVDAHETRIPVFATEVVSGLASEHGGGVPQFCVEKMLEE